MKVYLVKYRRRVEWEGDEFIFYVVAAERSWDAVVKLYRNVKEATILLTYNA